MTSERGVVSWCGVRVVVPAAAIVTLAAFLAGCGGIDRESQVRRNLRLLAPLPVFPGAVVTVTRTHAQYETQDGDRISGVIGYGTIRAYRAPRRSTPEAIFRFYRQRLRGWRLVDVEHSFTLAGTPLRARSVPARDVCATFARGDATLSLAIPEKPSNRIFRVGVHHRRSRG